MEREIKYIGKFKFDLEQEKCWWIKENGETFEIPKEWGGRGKIAYQKWFQLEGETNQSHWVNFSQTYSQEKVWINVWYKKNLLDGGRNDYFQRIEKNGNICEINFMEKDEMVKYYDEKKQKDRWMNKIRYEKQQPPSQSRTGETIII